MYVNLHLIFSLWGADEPSVGSVCLLKTEFFTFVDWESVLEYMRMNIWKYFNTLMTFSK